MMTYQSKFLQILHARGFFEKPEDITDAKQLDELLEQGEASDTPVVAYIGFDCTARSLHVGSLIQIMCLHWFQKCGHKPIVLLGGGTTKIGDPSGKDESRKLLTEEQIEENKAGIKQNFESFLGFEDSFNAKTTNAVMVDNAAWIDDMNHVDFLRDVARYFSVNRMLTMDSVRLRLERASHLSLLEFLYMAHQAHDFMHLCKVYGCRLQIGGSDQWGNIVGGIDLIEKKVVETTKNLIEEDLDKKHKEITRDLPPFKFLDAEYNKARNEIDRQHKDNKDYVLSKVLGKISTSAFGLTTPLLTTASGAKMGKTADGAVWLNADMLSPYDYWQFWRNTEDADVGRFLKFFTDLPLEEVERLSKLQGAEINEAKKILATHATAMLHGKSAAEDARRTAEDTFEKGKLGDDLPVFELPTAELEAGIPAFKLFHHAGLTASGKEARKLIQGGGARVNDEKIADENQNITPQHVTEEGVIKLSAGKKKHLLLKLV
jgi:tyrosyl-tRNA synthetase